jgi:hypothetical protein
MNEMTKRLVGALALILTGHVVSCSDADDGGSDSGAGTGRYAAERQACVDRINDFRATLGLPPLQRWTEEETCTDSQAQSDSQTGDAHGRFGDCSERAQNECPGWGSIEQTIQDCLQDMWDEGPGESFSEHGHFLNMSSPDHTLVACGFYETPDGEVWAIQNFR